MSMKLPVQESSAQELFDITPTPRILRSLGEIPYQPWQCIAEFIDNSIDAFDRAENRDASNRVIISWSSDKVAAAERQLEVHDTGPGMSLEEIQNSVRAGYTSNKPISNLGLFGMGFNIATARLGEKTRVLSTRKGATEWVGLDIDFAELTRLGVFKAPAVRLPKTSIDQHGTRIIVSNLRPGAFDELRKNEKQIRDTIANVYATILANSDVEIMIQGKVISPRRYCVWDAKRYVYASRGTDIVPAILPIDESLDEALFDLERNRYLTPDEEDEAWKYKVDKGELPDGVVPRSKRIHGWLGIQRYPDPNDFGIDFIRNERKILIRDKSLFLYRNTLTGTEELEYPVELSGTVGGRIIGEIHIDHVPPTYQKNDFDRTDSSWYEVVERLRGLGPIRPERRKAMGFDFENNSPIARLVRGYGNCRQGTRYLAAPNDVAREWAREFYKDNPDFLSDEKWWEAAKQAQQQKDQAGGNAKKTPPFPTVDPGSDRSDDLSLFGPGANDNTAIKVVENGKDVIVPPDSADDNQPDTLETLKTRAERVVADSRKYSYPGCQAPFRVTVWQIISGGIRTSRDNDAGVPCILFSDGSECDFFFNPRHPFFLEYPTTYKDLLLVQLAERFKLRDIYRREDIATWFVDLVTSNCPDRRIDSGRLQEEAKLLFSRIRLQLPELLSMREPEVIECVHEATGEVEEIAAMLFDNPELMKKFQNKSVGAIDALVLAPARTVVRLIDKFPEEFLDGKLFRRPYQAIQLPDPKATVRLRNEAKDRLLSFLKDALWVINENISRQSKLELERCAHSLEFLEQEIEA